MKKIFFALTVLALAGMYSCGKQGDPGVQPPDNFGTSPAPTATIVLTKNTYSLQENVTPTATVMNVGSYSWDFGDGSSPSTSSSPTHTYLVAGVYTMTLTVKSPDKSRTYITKTKVVVGHRYFDSAVVMQVPLADSLLNPWNANLSNPNIMFNFAKVSGPNVLTKNLVWVNVDPRKNFNISWSDSSIIELTAETWVFTIYNTPNTNGSGPFSPMHSWKRNMMREINNPCVLSGSSPLNPYQARVYWSVH